MRTCLVTLLLLVGTVHADPPGLTPPTTVAPSADDTGSYRLQTAGMDALAIGLFAIADKDDSGAAGGLGVATYVGGGPLMHLIHHHTNRALLSLALRVGLPLVGGAIGNALGSSHCSDDCDNDADIAGTAWGVIAGAIVASVIDVGYLSRGDDVAERPIQPPPTSSSPALASPERHEVRVGLAFAF